MNVVTLTIAYYPDPNVDKAVAGGFVYIGEPDTNPTVEVNQKSIFVLQENGTLVEIAQPITLGTGGVPVFGGSAVSIYTVGDYSTTVQDSTTAQVYHIPRTTAQEATGTQFPVWDIGTTYVQNAYVTGSDDRLYYSIAGANLGNDPTSTSVFWQGIAEVGDIQSATETDQGIIELATQAEVDTGTEKEMAVTPFTLAQTSVPLATLAATATKHGVGANALNVKTIDMGDWDMENTASITVTHGLDLTKIRYFSAVVRNDDDTSYSPLTLGFTGVAGSEQAGYIVRAGVSSVTLNRTLPGSYSHPDYNSTSYNRGWVTIWYID